MRDGRHIGWVAALALMACAPSTMEARAPEPQLTHAAPSETPTKTTATADYLLIVSPHLEADVEPLVQHRRALGHDVAVVNSGLDSADSIKATIDAVYANSNGALRHVLLVGDAAGRGESTEGLLPTFYLHKVGYAGREPRDFEFPTDSPYGTIDGQLELAVGRLPVRRPHELRAMVKKLIRYETSPVGSAWPRRLTLRAGTAGFSAFTDAALERAALGMLSDEVPYDFDLRVTFGKEGSSYASRPDRLQESLKEDAEAGALFFAYVGHSGKSRLQRVRFGQRRYSLGTRDDFADMHVANGAPVFLSLACDSGAYDMRRNDHSIADAAVLNPFGPIAAFASSRVSHPYPNLLYGKAFIEAFLQGRPKTLGEGIVELKKRMLDSSNLLGELLSQTNTDALKHEHVALYNLLGDPATRLRYPQELTLTGPTEAATNTDVTFEIASPVAGSATLTLETERRAMPHQPIPLDGMARDEALIQMDANHRRANDKTVSKRELAVTAGRNEVTLTLPTTAGKHVVKVFVRSGDGKRFAAGHRAILVK